MKKVKKAITNKAAALDAIDIALDAIKAVHTSVLAGKLDASILAAIEAARSATAAARASVEVMPRTTGSNSLLSLVTVCCSLTRAAGRVQRFCYPRFEKPESRGYYDQQDRY